MRTETKTTEPTIGTSNRVDDKFEQRDHKAITFCDNPVTETLGIVVGSYVLDWVI